MKRPYGVSLRSRFLVLFVLIFLGGAAASYAVMAWFTRDISGALAGRSALVAVTAVLIAALALTVVIAAIVFDRIVLRRLAVLDAAARQISPGNYSVRLPQQDSDELGRLGRSFQEMAERIATHTTNLEQQVAERTRVLVRQTQADSLTGLLNRLGMSERIEIEKNRLGREGAKLGTLILDLDHLKKINDSHGRDVGDKALVHTAQTIRSVMRSYDLCSRWGGEEFLVLVPHIASRNALTIVAEKLRAEIKARPLAFEGAKVFVSVSIGGYFADPKENTDAILKSADDALSLAKQNGRDRTIVTETAASPAG